MKQVTKQQLENSIKNALSLLDEYAFEDMCDDGKEAVLNMAKLVGFNIRNFVPEKEYTVEFSSNRFCIPADDDIKNYTAKVMVFNEAGNMVFEQKIDSRFFREE